MKKQLKYYSLDAILEKDAHYNMIIGERSNGKTTAILKYCLEHYIKTGGKMAYIRRYEDDIKGSRGASVFNSIIAIGALEKITEGRWTNIIYKGRCYYLAVEDPEKEDKYILEPEPFCYAFALTQQERYKGNSYPDVETVFFDEMMTRSFYLANEFIEYMNLLSTIIRQRDNVRIFMAGNTVNKYCPYFQEMGLSHIKEMKRGTIDLYQYGKSGLKVAVEFADFPSKQKPSDVYFAFDNPQLNMITGQGGVWEIAVYPHAPCKWRPKDIAFTYFIQYDGDMLQCEIITLPEGIFTFVHRKTTPLKDPDKDIIFSPTFDIRPNWRRNILKPRDKIGEKITRLFLTQKVFYQDNETGEIVRNYLMFCKRMDT